MALIKCFECGNEVSDNALFCTKCGVKLEPKKEVVTNKSNTGINKLITIFSAIFISLYSIFCIYMLYTNIKGFFEYIDDTELVYICSYFSSIIYYLGSAALLWMLFIYNLKHNKIFKLIGGIIIAVMVFAALIYYLVGLFTWVDSIEYFFELLGNILQIFFGSYGIPISLYLLFINKK